MFPALPSPRTTGARRAPRTFPGALAGALAAGTALTLTTGCGLFSPGQNGDMPDDITVTSPLMQEGRPLADAYSCVGEETGQDGERETVSPPLTWSGLPEDTVSIALVVDDPQAAEVFWVLYDLDPQLGELRQNTVPADARQGLNSAGEASYDPPCPEEDDPHGYRFTVYALQAPLDLPEGAELGSTLEAIAERAIGRGSLVTGTG
ncbi:YbhB/YbcL family Raf kinase inhibitor-like protein [Nocardiopsis lambiniae]|uniref:YbhB/YbcL family Raf kinase inhibitor-like protein n=1 Tax=Nocardiopsis lambiniae TaxID=3075539 RepID=A0ABU2MAD8_9ACTN|nr:YbhB/YbcL family Raf kinase inhibitor-like protein [Nocardiopsis sp. DSM 44743]MDT0329633.1 YbhB/YbcL family Raf kinase inhibitor-like protein [Nocardiopsis sp. DSM 44743]